MTEAPFRVEEATIEELHRAIQDGRTTCVDVVQQYLARVRAYNGVCSMLVTADGAPVPEAVGAVRGGAALRFPTETLPAAHILPDLDRYAGPPLEFGRMEPTASDPAVQQQFGMIAGIPDAGQVNALATLNIRGERSVTCRGEFDRAPADGPLPPGAPPMCEMFRHLPDALERAAELDAAYGRNPDLEAMPMYGVVVSFKDSFDTKDMRSTGGGDAAYDMDVPARDHILVEQLRAKGAIIFAKAVCTEYNGRAGDPGGRHAPDKVLPSTLGYQRSTWGGNPSNPYDTTRSASLGSSSGSALSVSTNMVMVSLGEETRASCRGPSNHNAVALILPHKAMLGFDGGAIGADIYCDRSGIHARRLVDAAKVLDALKDEANGYYDPRDPYTTVPRPSVLAGGYTRHAAASGAAGALAGRRIGVVRESMLNPGIKLVEPITTRGRGRDPHGARRASRRDAGGIRPTRSGRPTRPASRCAPASARRWRGSCRCSCRSCCSACATMGSRCSRRSPPRSADRVPARQGVRQRPYWRPSTTWWRMAEGSIEPPPNLDIATIQQQELATDVPLPHLAIPAPAGPRIGRRSAIAKRWPIGRR